MIPQKKIKPGLIYKVINKTTKELLWIEVILKISNRPGSRDPLVATLWYNKDRYHKEYIPYSRCRDDYDDCNNVILMEI